MQNVNQSLNESLQAKYLHLELSVLSLSQVQKDNESKRIDSEYFKKEYLENEARLLNLNPIQLKDTDISIKHPAEIQRNYVDSENGVWFFRTQNLRPLFIDSESNQVFISKQDAKRLAKNLIQKDDILITRTGANCGDCAVYNIDIETIASSHILIAKNSFFNQCFLAVFLNTQYGKKQINRGIYGGLQPEIAPYYLKNIYVPQFPQDFQLEIQNLVQDSHKALEDSKALYKEAENLLYEALGLDSHNPLESLQTYCHTESVARSISNNNTQRDISLNAQYDNEFSPSLRESANADSWQSISYIDKGKTHAKAPSAREGEQTICHTESVARSISNNPQNRDISPFSQAQYDNLDSSLSTKAQNDNVMDCHENSNEFSRNDTLSCHTRSPLCHTERSEVSKNTNTISQNHLDSSLRASHFAQNDNVNSPSLARSDSQFSPSLAEGARGWVEKYPHLNLSIRPLSQSYGISGRLDSEYYQTKYDAIERKIRGFSHKKLGDLVTIQKSIEPGSEAYQDKGIEFVRVANLSKFGISKSDICLSRENFAKELEKLAPKKETILLSKDGSIGISYCLEEDLECITSGAILHLKVKDKNEILPQVLSLILNSIAVKLQAERDSGGSIIAHWKISEIENVLIPLLDFKLQEQIASKIQKSFVLRKNAKDLLQSAKAKVEQNIENSAK
ncbi:restriction endonuclease subunit S [Helicobacter sp. 23-1048]